jgi:uncharacterized protein YmfQ (DUF2313 family)
MPNQDDYKELQKNLLPGGRAWSREDATNLVKLLIGRAKGYEVLDRVIQQFPLEAIPSTTLQLLSDWERIAALPDPCTESQQPDQTVEERRQSLVTKLSSSGSLSVEFFQALAQSLGFEIEIREYNDFKVGISTVGQALTNGQDWAFTFEVLSDGTDVKTFKVGSSTVGEKLATFGNILLQCAIINAKPAYTNVIFTDTSA